MASRVLLPSLRRPVLPAFTIRVPTQTTTRSRKVAAATLTSLVTAHFFFTGPLRQNVRMDAFSSAPASSVADSIRNYSSRAKNPVVDQSGKVNPRIFRQISTGSVLGLTTGALLSFFSKPLAILLGLAVFGLQVLDRKGIHLIPYDRIQRAVGDIDLKTAMIDNVAFKLSFGVTCALAGFGSF